MRTQVRSSIPRSRATPALGQHRRSRLRPAVRTEQKGPGLTIDILSKCVKQSVEEDDDWSGNLSDRSHTHTHRGGNDTLGMFYDESIRSVRRQLACKLRQLNKPNQKKKKSLRSFEMRTSKTRKPEMRSSNQVF